LELTIICCITEEFDCCLLPQSSKHKQQCDIEPVLISSPSPAYAHTILRHQQYREYRTEKYCQHCPALGSFSSLQRARFGSVQGFSHRMAETGSWWSTENLCER